MSLSLAQFAFYIVSAVVIGGALGWLARGPHAQRQTRRVLDKWQDKYDEAARQRDRFNAENAKLRTSIEAQQAAVAKHELAASRFRTELESAIEKVKSLSKELFASRAERDDLQRRSGDLQGALQQARQQVADLESEFEKAGVFYKGELQKSLDKRKDLAAELDDARAEQESLQNLLVAAQREGESVNKMLTAAQNRLDNLDAMEQKVITLEAENAQLRHDGASSKQRIEVLQRDVAELDELKVQNRELSHCLQSMESSRRQYEQDAKRYREKADQSDKRSETLRMKLDDVEKSFSDMARKHDEALRVVDRQAVRANGHAANGNGSGGAERDEREVDDLTKIVGIGKVFEGMLHRLGIRSFRQIANFGPADIARVNVELKEFKGRMEQDDWVGQAKELFFEKYGGGDRSQVPSENHE